MLTDRGKLVLVAALPLWLVSRAFGIPEASMAALACPVLVVLAVAYTRLASTRLALRRRVHPTRLFHDAEATVDLAVRNDGRLSTAILRLEDDVSSSIVEGDPSFVLSPLPAGRVRHLTYDLRGRARGRYEVGPARVWLRDPFGIAQRRVPFSRVEEVVVYPPVWALPATLPRMGRAGSTTEGSARPLAVRGEFANVREYVRGDDLRKVHWRTTARRGKLMVKQEEAPQETAATIVVDTRREAHEGSGPHSTFEHAIAAAASAAYDLAQHHYGLRMVTGPFSTPPTSMSWRLALEQLAVLEPQRGASYRPVWRQVGHGTAGDGLLVAILPVPSAVELREIVRAGRAFGARAALQVLPANSRRAEERAESTTAALRVAGWHVATYRVGTRLDEAWRGFAVRPRKAGVAG